MQKLTVILALFVATATTAFADENTTQLDTGRYIAVTGESELIIIPNEFHFVVELQEYYLDKKGNPISSNDINPDTNRPYQSTDYAKKINLAEIESKFEKLIQQLNIPKKDINLLEISKAWNGRSRNDVLINKRIEIKFNDINLIDKLTKTLPNTGIFNFYISEVKNNDMPKYNKEGKIKALQDAKNKATYLAETAAVKLGKVKYITEDTAAHNISYRNFINQNLYTQTMQAEQKSAETKLFSGNLSIKPLKVKYTLNVQFMIE